MNNMNNKPESLMIDNVKYIREDSISQIEKPNIEGMPYVMIRTYSAGVHCGYLKSKEGKEVTLLESIRIWKWSGAASLSQLSQEGTNNPNDCMFGVPINEIILTEAIEIIYMTETAKQSIQNVKSWKN